MIQASRSAILITLLLLAICILDAFAGSKPRAAPEGYVWHHVRTIGDALLIPEHWLGNGDLASETPRCDIRVLDAGPELLEAAAMFVLMIPALQLADGPEPFLTTMDKVIEGQEILGRGKTKRKKVRAWWLESRGLDDEGQPEARCQLLLIDPKLGGGRWLSYSATTGPIIPSATPTVVIPDYIESMIGDCLDMYTRYTQSGIEGPQHSIAGCTLDEEGKISTIASNVEQTSFEWFVSTIDQMHGIESFRAVAGFSREPFTTSEGNEDDAVRVHLESRDWSACVDFWVLAKPEDDKVPQRVHIEEAACTLWPR